MIELSGMMRVGFSAPQWSSAIAFITFFVTVFAAVIALAKDLPDIRGDVEHGISTFATKIGVRKLAWFTSCVLLANYCLAILLAFKFPLAFRIPAMAGGHAALATVCLINVSVGPPFFSTSLSLCLSFLTLALTPVIASHAGAHAGTPRLHSRRDHLVLQEYLVRARVLVPPVVCDFEPNRIFPNTYFPGICSILSTLCCRAFEDGRECSSPLAWFTPLWKFS